MRLSIRHSISAKVLCIIVACILAASAFLGLFAYMAASERHFLEFGQQAEQAADRLAFTLVEPMRRADREQALHAMSIEMDDPALLGVVVEDFQGSFFTGLIRTPEGDAQRLVLGEGEPFRRLSRSFLTLDRTVYYNNQDIGLAELHFTDAPVRERIAHNVTILLVQVAGAALLLVGALYFSLNRMVLAPLTSFEQTVRRYRDRDFTARSSIRSTDEIGHLAGAFNEMADQLQEGFERQAEQIEEIGRTNAALTEEINQRARAQHDMRQAWGYLNDIINTVPDPVFVKDRLHRYVLGNDAFCELIGAPRHELIGKTDLDCFPEHEARLFRRKDDEVFATGKPSLSIENMTDGLGHTRVFSTKKTLMTARESDEPVLIGVSRDISDHKLSEDRLADINRNLETMVRERTRDLVRKAGELVKANRRLRELDEMKSSFLSSVSHELRTPLTSVRGFAKLIRRDFTRWVLNDEAQPAPERLARIVENLEIIEREGERLTRLIDDVLDLNKIESGRMAWKDRELDVAPFLRATAQATGGQFTEPDVELRIEIPDDLGTALIDPDRLAQIVTNLLSNAAKFTSSGHVTLRAESPDETQGDGFRFEVEDTGPGIPEEDLERIFDKFHQVRNDTLADKPRGTGLGLAICKEICDHYGGTITAHSRPGRGSTFRVSLPRTPAPQPVADPILPDELEDL